MNVSQAAPPGDTRAGRCPRAEGWACCGWRAGSWPAPGRSQVSLVDDSQGGSQQLCSLSGTTFRRALSATSKRGLFADSQPGRLALGATLLWGPLCLFGSMCDGSELCLSTAETCTRVEGSGDLALSSEGDNRAGRGHACTHGARGTQSPIPETSVTGRRSGMRITFSAWGAAVTYF